MGGAAKGTNGRAAYLNDVYLSDDGGLSWEVATDHAPWAGNVIEITF